MAEAWGRWLSPGIRASPEGRRSALVIAGGASFALVFVTAHLLTSVVAGHLDRTVPALVFLTAPVTCLALLQLRATTRAAGHVLIGASTLLISVAIAGEDLLQAGTVAWYGVVCALAIMSLGLRTGLRWLAFDAVLVLGLELLRARGLITPWLHPGPMFTLLRGLGLVLAFVVLAALFERTRQHGLADAEQLNQSKSNFLANVSHELRTPMNGVLGLTELLLRSNVDAEQREHLELLQRSSRSLVVLLNDLLDMSKVEAGKMQLDPTDFELEPLLKDLAALHRPVAQARGLAFELTLPPSMPRAVRGDAMRLRQVLTNLLGNAIKFTPKGRVQVTVALSGEHYDFAVKDTGIGIPRATLPSLFTAFAQAEAGTTRRFGGTGLGLALSRQLVELMGGTLEIESQEGEGTTASFSVTLPPSLMALVETAATPPTEALTTLPVLVVDDNPINLKVACGLVQKCGYRTLVAHDGAEALELVQRVPVCLVLMDCHMPVMDGFEATEKIRQLDGDVALVPIVALTASAMPEELARCLTSGMNDTLIKPVTLEQLARTLQQVNALRELMTVLT